jgi:hypothetical protein
MNDRMMRLLTITFWTLALSVLIQCVMLGFSQDKGVTILRTTILLQTSLALPMILWMKETRTKTTLLVIAEWITLLILAPAISMK